MLPKPTERDIMRGIGTLLELDAWRLLWCEPISRREWGKGFGEPGMPDLLCIRYSGGGTPQSVPQCAEVLWIEGKRPGGTVAPLQRCWHRNERLRGALTVILGEDCEASVEGWLKWYRESGLMRRPIE